jgi:succinoglycan biosynthesis transport protein ExoP
VLARDVESDKAMYQAVLNRMKETAVTKDLKPNKIRIVQPATVPERPIKPDRTKVIAFGILAGLGLGLLMVMLLNAIDRSLKTVDQTEEFLGLPVLSAVPKFSGLKQDKPLSVLTDDAQSAEAESFRTLRTSLAMTGGKENRRTVLFTSALPAEGKTFCSLNYALSLAQQGLRTLVIDCDLRRPMVEALLDCKQGQGQGVTDYLTKQKKFDEVVYATDSQNLFYVPAGGDVPNPAELLANTGVDSLIDEALLQFDRVIVDSAPIHAVSDTLLILNRIQSVCLVVRVRKTPQNAVQRAVKMLLDAKAPLTGIILNLLPRNRGRGYYYDSHYEYAYRGKYGKKKVCVQ